MPASDQQTPVVAQASTGGLSDARAPSPAGISRVLGDHLAVVVDVLQRGPIASASTHVLVTDSLRTSLLLARMLEEDLARAAPGHVPGGPTR